MQKSISDRISFLFLSVTLIPVLFFCFFLANERHRSLEEELLNKRQEEVRYLGNLVSDYLEKLTVEVELVSGLFARQGMEDSQKFILLKTLQALHPAFSDFGTMDRRGRKFMVHQEDDGIRHFPLTNDAETLAEIVSRKEIIASIVYETEKKIPRLRLVSPIFFLNKQFIDGAILATANLEELNRLIIRRTTQMGTEGVLMLSDGAIVSKVSSDLLDDSTLSKFKSSSVQTGSTIIDNKVLAYTPIRYHDLNFVLIIASDLGQLTQLWNQSLRNYLIFSVLIMIAILFTGHFLVRRLFATPLGMLTEAAEKIRDGELGHHVNIEGENEFSELADTFNSMASALQESHIELRKESRQRQEAEASSRKAMLEAQRANGEKSIFLANMSHEIRTPVNGILGLSTLLLNSPLSKEQHYRLELISHSSKRLFSILDTILNFSRIEAGETRLQASSFQPRKLVEEALILLQMDVEGKDLKLTGHVGDTIPETLLADSDKINQVLVNLVSNGIKNTESGEVSVALTISSENRETVTLCFCVADTGSGVSEDIGKTIFQPFTQGENGLNNKARGVGLGLAISDKLARLMGGKLWFENNQKAGSSFYFTCDCVKLAKADHRPVKNQNGNSNGKVLMGLTIAVAEDEYINQYMLAAFLKEMGAEVISCGNGQELLLELEKNRPDVILMDIQMPVMDGLEATARIRNQEETEGLSPLTIIALTAHATNDMKETCYSTGVNLCLTKPLDLPLFPEILLAELAVSSE